MPDLKPEHFRELLPHLRDHAVSSLTRHAKLDPEKASVTGEHKELFQSIENDMKDRLARHSPSVIAVPFKKEFRFSLKDKKSGRKIGNVAIGGGVPDVTDAFDHKNTDHTLSFLSAMNATLAHSSKIKDLMNRGVPKPRLEVLEPQGAEEEPETTPAPNGNQQHTEALSSLFGKNRASMASKLAAVHGIYDDENLTSANSNSMQRLAKRYSDLYNPGNEPPRSGLISVRSVPAEGGMGIEFSMPTHTEDSPFEGVTRETFLGGDKDSEKKIKDIKKVNRQLRDERGNIRPMLKKPGDTHAIIIHPNGKITLNEHAMSNPEGTKALAEEIHPAIDRVHRGIAKQLREYHNNIKSHSDEIGEPLSAKLEGVGHILEGLDV